MAQQVIHSIKQDGTYVTPSHADFQTLEFDSFPGVVR